MSLPALLGGRIAVLGRAAARAYVEPTALPRLAVALALLVPLSSAATPEPLPFLVPAAVMTLGALSAYRPAWGLVILSALIPVAGWAEQGLGLSSLRWAETLVLAVLAGALAGPGHHTRSSAVGSSALPKGVWPFACLLVTACAASSALEWRLSRVGDPGTVASVADLVRSLSTTYLHRDAAPVPGLVDAALLMEGVALFLLILHCSRRDPDLPRRLAVASLAGAAGAAAVNLSAVVERVVSSGAPMEELVWYLGGVGRPSSHIADVNAAGSYFLLMTLTGIGLTLAGGRRFAYSGALLSLAVGTAFWLSGSRTAVAAALIVCVGSLLRSAWRRKPIRSRRATLAAAALLAVVLPVAVLWAYPGRDGVDGALTSARIRVAFVATSLSMWGTDPLFGVGAGRYYGTSERFMDPFIQDLWRENAHNNFLQVGAELGVLGLAGFVGLLVTGTRSVHDALRTRAGPTEPLLAGAAAGITAYLVTCLAGHPLLTPETAYPFWIVGGVAVALAHRRAFAFPASSRRSVVTALGIGLFFVGTADVRVDEAVRDAAARQDARFGAFAWETDHAAARRFRWIGPRAAFFVPGDGQPVRIPLRAPHARRDRPVAVDVAVNGTRIARLPVFHDHWVQVPLLLPASGGWYGIHRVAFTVDPPWPPGERRNGDGRTLGVMVGEIETDRPRRK